MACGCSKRRESVAEVPQVAGVDEATSEERLSPKKRKMKTLPTDQCVACLQKHCDEAWVHWHEYGYSEENRRAIRGNLRAMVLHSYKDHPAIANLAREMALLVQDVRDAEVEERFPVLCGMVDDVYYASNPDAKARLEALRGLTDVIIPLGTGSKSNDDELRFLLRSLDIHGQGVGKVYIATTHVPDWLDTDKVVIVPIEDVHQHNKDANLIAKTLRVIRMYDIESFLWCADDNVFLRDVRLSEVPIIRNLRTRDKLIMGTTWQTRLIHTMDWAESRGVKMEGNFESHCPQYFSNAQRLADRMADVDYISLPGLTIMTAFRVVMGEAEEKGIPQPEIKLTVEQPYNHDLGECGELMFLGYNDIGFYSGLREDLQLRFPQKSRYEK